MTIKKVILLAGCDKTGKSTLSAGIAATIANNKKNGLEVHYEHGESTTSVEQAIATGHERLANIRKLESAKEDYVVVLDRFNVPDEWVYYTVFTGNTFTPEQMKDYQNLSDWFWLLDPVVLYTKASPETIATRFASDNEELVSPEKIDMILDRYEAYFDIHLPEHIKLYTLDSTLTTPKTLLVAGLEKAGFDSLGNYNLHPSGNKA